MESVKVVSEAYLKRNDHSKIFEKLAILALLYENPQT